jgi:hypothetical protein
MKSGRPCSSLRRNVCASRTDCLFSLRHEDRVSRRRVRPLDKGPAFRPAPMRAAEQFRRPSLLDLARPRLRPE